MPLPTAPEFRPGKQRKAATERVAGDAYISTLDDGVVLVMLHKTDARTSFRGLPLDVQHDALEEGAVLAQRERGMTLVSSARKDAGGFAILDRVFKLNFRGQDLFFIYRGMVRPNGAYMFAVIAETESLARERANNCFQHVKFL